MTLLLIAFFSGVLTVLAPCVLPLLPIVLGASAGESQSRRVPLLIIASLSISIIVFSLLLKASTLLIGVPPSFWKAFSGGMIIVLGIITLFPNIWKKITTQLHFSDNSNKFLAESQGKQGILKYVFMGAALGPVFSSCSPTYALILAIVLPAGFVFGILALISYTFGLAVILFAIAVFGQKLIKNLKWASDPNGIFKKALGIIFIFVGVAIISGYDKKIEAALLDAGFLNTTNFEQRIIDSLELEKIEKTPNTTQKNTTSDLGIIDTQRQEDEYICQSGACENKDIPVKIGSMIGEKAPDFLGLTNWKNTSEISSLSELQGKVVMIDFWTLGCINCINTHDETNLLYEEFHEAGLEIIGIHAPEFSYEKNVLEVEKAIEKFNIKFPVAQDNDFLTWKAYNNRYWPAFYIIDKQGFIRHTHFGEAGYEKKRDIITQLLQE